MKRGREGISTKIQTPEERKDFNMARLLQRLGREGTPEEQGEIEAVLTRLREEIELTPKVGRQVEKTKAGRKEFVIPLTSQEQKDRLTETLFDLGIHPWEDQGLLIIDRKSDIEKLEIAGIIKNAEYKEAVQNTEIKLGPDVDAQRFAFPLPNVQPVERRKHERAPKVEELFDAQAEEPEVDTELLNIVRRFDAGLVDEDEPEFEQAVGFMPTLKMFPHMYVWDRKTHTHTHARTGEVIGKEQEAELLARAREGDERAKNEFIRLHTGFVIYFAKRMQERLGGDVDEYFQNGLLGLEYSLRNFDPEKEGGGKFTAYAAVCIEGFMRKDRTIYDSPVSNRSSKVAEVRKLRRKEDKLQQLRGPGNDTDDDIFRMKGIERLERRLLIDAEFDPLEDHENDEQLVIQPSQDEQVDAERLRQRVSALLLTLSPRTEKVIRLRFGLGEFNQSKNYALGSPTEEGLTYEAIGQIMGITRETVRQIEARALRKLKHPSRSRKLRTFLDEPSKNYNPRVTQPRPEFEDNGPEKPIPPTEFSEEDIRLGYRRQWTPIDSLTAEWDLSWLQISRLADKYKEEHPEWFHENGELHEELVDLLAKEVEEIKDRQKYSGNWMA